MDLFRALDKCHVGDTVRVRLLEIHRPGAPGKERVVKIQLQGQNNSGSRGGGGSGGYTLAQRR